MARIFITGSSDGLGLMTARALIKQGHNVTLHARSIERASQTKQAAPGADQVLVADITTLSGMKHLASEANKLDTFDTVIHNAGVGFTQPSIRTADGFAHVFAINSLAPYVLTALMKRPKRLIYVSSGLHHGGDGSLKDVTWSERRWDALQAYSDSKLQNIIMAFAMARRWKDVESIAMTPGWVKTKMGGWDAPGEAEDGADRMIDVATRKKVQTGTYYGTDDRKHSSPDDVNTQDEYLRICEQLSGLSLPKH